MCLSKQLVYKAHPESERVIDRLDNTIRINAEICHARVLYSLMCLCKWALLRSGTNSDRIDLTRRGPLPGWSPRRFAGRKKSASVAYRPQGAALLGAVSYPAIAQSSDTTAPLLSRPAR